VRFTTARLRRGWSAKPIDSRCAWGRSSASHQPSWSTLGTILTRCTTHRHISDSGERMRSLLLRMFEYPACPLCALVFAGLTVGTC
jgi:hypothetical protein